ncbi:hypothetical protein AGMMS49983_03400 [Clostridia bacterium]|nr:hypothetical protein AGMMS49983_03400 [Clostridia bacterium]
MGQAEVRHGIRGFLTARDELSLRGVRRAFLAGTLLFPLAIILSDVLYRHRDAELFGIDSVLLQSMLYGLAYLIAALVPKAVLPVLLRIGAWGGAALAIPSALYSDAGTVGLLLAALFQFFIGLAAAGGFHAFCYICNNAERWLGVMLIGIYYGLSWAFYDAPGAEIFLRTILPFALACLLVFVTFFVREDEDKAVSETISENAGKAQGYYAVLLIAVVYYLIGLTNSWLESGLDFMDDRLYGVGLLLGALAAAIVQLVFNRSVWHLWNLYLLLAVIGLVTSAFGGGLRAQPGSLLYGFADNIGYLAMLYLLGSVAKMDGRHGFYRWICVFAFLFGAVLPAILNQAFARSAGPVSILAVTIVFASVGVCLVLSPVLNKHVFASDWADSLHALDTEAYAKASAEVEAADAMDALGLTAREKQVFTLLMTGLAKKQVAAELKISNATANFHANNLYRKLNVQSRAELFAKYHTIGSE